MLLPLTTVQMSQVELAQLAFDAQLAEVEREEPLSEGSEYVLKTALITRESTGICNPLENTVKKLTVDGLLKSTTEARCMISQALQTWSCHQLWKAFQTLAAQSAAVLRTCWTLSDQFP